MNSTKSKSQSNCSNRPVPKKRVKKLIQQPSHGRRQQKHQAATPDPLLLFQQIITGLGSVLSHRTASWFGTLTVSILLAIAKRRTITKRIQAAGLSNRFQRVFYHLTNIGRKYPQLFKNMLEQIINYHRELLNESPYQ